MKIVGIVGFAGSGKDTVGRYLISNYGFERYSFAQPLKDIVSSLFGWERSLLEGDTEESRKWREQPDYWWEEKLDWLKHHNFRFTPRVALQNIGTDVLRNHFNDNIWLLCLENWLRNIQDKNIVITDCRFPNELDLIKKYNSKVLRVRRGSEPVWYNDAIMYNLSKSSKLPDSLKNIHSSERDWIGFNFDSVINNDKDLSFLENQVNDIIRDW